MTDKSTDPIEQLVKKTEQDLNRQLSPGTKAANFKKDKRTGPKLSFSLTIWLVTVVVVAFQYSSITTGLLHPSSESVESDLSSIVTKAAATLKTYRDSTGALPYVIPNPAIRGLVHYERQSDFAFILTANAAGITIEFDSARNSPRRLEGETH